MNYEQLLTDHFKLKEFVRSQNAERLGIDNTPSQGVVVNLMNLCRQILEPARLALGQLTISSGYRSGELNKATPGSSLTSAHVFGYAADVIPEKVTKMAFAKWVANNIQFDQIILEFGILGDPAWVHVSSDPRNRREIFRILNDGKGYVPIML